MKDRAQEQTPSAVPKRAPQDGEIRARWAWTEPEVWTERMLATLETGIEGGKWFRLIDKVWSPKSLGRSLEKVVAKGGSAGIDNQSARQIEVHRDQTIANLEQELRASQYQPQAVKRVWIPKPGSQELRPLGVPTLRDKIVQGALLQVVEPIFERDFAPQSYGFRPGKGCKNALRRVDELLKGGSDWVVDADLKSYFDTIPQERLMQRIGEKIADGRVLKLVEQMLDFLGYHFERGMKWPRKKSMDKLKDTIRNKTRRTDGRSLKTICEDLNRTLRGWFGYFKHSKDNVFESVDGYTRGRLRSILRKRRGKHGRGYGRDNQRWPNDYFSAMGLFSLKQAYITACRSSCK